MARRLAARCLAVTLRAAAGIQGADAETANYHDFFERRCGSCHGHSGDLARDKLTIVDGRLLGRESGNEIRAYLADHYGGLDEALTARVHEVLFRQVRAGGLFKRKCAFCHGRARELAQASLIVVGGELRGRYSGRDMTEFLTRHGRLEGAEVAVVHEVLSANASGGW